MIQSTAHKAVHEQQGFVLVMVLVLIAFMSLALSTFSVWVNKEITLSRSLEKRVDTQVAAFSLKQNLLYLMAKGDFSARGLDFDPQKAKEEEGEEDTQKYISLHDKTYLADQFEIRFQDEGGLLNFKSLSKDKNAMKDLLEHFEVEDSEMEGFMAKLKDYTTRNPTGTAKSLGGASADDYKEANLPPPTFRPLRTPWEIKRVLGWRSHEAFFKDEALPNILSTVVQGKINLNTAPPVILDFLKGITPEIKEFLLEKRKTDTPYIKHLRDITNATGQKFRSDLGIGVFPSRTIRATITSKEINFNTQLSVSQTLNEKTPWRINYEIELASAPRVAQEQAEESSESKESEGSEIQQSVFPDPTVLFAQDTGSDST